MALSWALEKALKKYDADAPDMSLAKALAEYGGWIPATTQAGKVAESLVLDGETGEEYENCSFKQSYLARSTKRDFGGNDLTVYD